MVEASRVHAATAITCISIRIDASPLPAFPEPLDIPEHLVRVAFGRPEAIRRAVALIPFVPALSGARTLEVGHDVGESLGTSARQPRCPRAGVGPLVIFSE